MKRLPALPAERALKILSGRWKLPLLYYVMQEPRRLSELQRLVPGITQKVLIQQLREMESHGLVRRQAHPGTTRVDYLTTDLAEALRPLLPQLCAWGQLTGNTE
jgi:DNA-binding HxlR family transcriptional regulator